MAKSLRSKRARKLRAFKRIRYGEKELERLKKMLAVPTVVSDQHSTDTDLTELNNPENAIEKPLELIMDVDTPISVKTEPEEHKSKFPVWLTSYKIKKLAKEERKRKKKETKRLIKDQKKNSKKRKNK